MSADVDGVRAAADRLTRAEHEATPCAPVRGLIDAGDLDAAYAVQRLVRHQAAERGRRRSGWKIGLTSEAVQRQLGVDQPDFGVLFEDMDQPEHDLIDPARLLQPKIEAEVAFVLAADLVGDITVDDVRAAIAYAIPALEIVDSRIAGWDITIVDTIADNASCGMYVLGGPRLGLGDVDLPAIGMELSKDGTVVSSGGGSACMGDPVVAATWLAAAAAGYGEWLRAGDVILSGALGPMVEVTPGSSFTARLSGLGEVTAAFAERNLDG
jgi:2-keto-4-pentenoate hydratase